MEINKQLFEDVLARKLKGTFVLRNGDKINSDKLYRNKADSKYFYPYFVNSYSYTAEGYFDNMYKDSSAIDIIDFIPDTNMKENELIIEIPSDKVVDWDESKKQNKIVLKNKQLTYEEICKKLFYNNGGYFINSAGGIVHCDTLRSVEYHLNNAVTEHQLECILAKNQLANTAKYLNGEWKPIYNTSVWIIVYDCYLGYHATSIQVESIAFNCYGLVIFKSKELAQQAIEILGKETIKLALEPLGI